MALGMSCSAVCGLAGVDTSLREDLSRYGTIDKLHPSHVYPSVTEAIDAFRRETSPTG